ncbi:MAG: carboxypeptidase-like regulatory domain-containing protein, partial [Cyclobacteriaceae bacterium]
MKAAIVFIVIFFMTLMGVAQPCTYVRGTITDAETRERLPGANIRLQADWRTGTSTDSLGHFIIKAQAGDTLVASFIGYKESAFIIRECEIVILLEPYAQLTGEVVVKAERLIAEEFRTMKADKLDIYTNPTAKADPLLAVNTMPAATTLDESANISLRGSTAQETGIFLNNVPIYDGIRYGQLNGIGTFSIFNTA